MFYRFKTIVALSLALVFVGCSVIRANPVIERAPVTALLADRIGSFRAYGAATVVDAGDPLLNVTSDNVTSAARTYIAPGGQRLTAVVFTAPSQSAVYAILTQCRNARSQDGTTPNQTDIGTAGFAFPESILFVQGKAYVVVKAANGADPKLLESFAKEFSNKLERGEDEIPVLVKHLPDWESVHGQVSYFVNPDDLRTFHPAPVFGALTFEGGAEAASATYGSARLVVVEFTTPQHATDADARVRSQIESLRNQGQQLPTAYRRVGNYGVFVFNAADTQAANQLIDQIKYEQVTQWLGDNPYPFLEMQRRYTATTLGVLVSVVKASGIALVTCLSVGGLFGGLLFLRRRAQQKTVDAYSDAGGMLRLNLDELTPQTDPARLLGRGH
jgi:hypothetical protein